MKWFYRLERGTALIVALTILVLISSLSATYLSMSVAHGKSTQMRIFEKRALAAADSMMDVTLSDIFRTTPPKPQDLVSKQTTPGVFDYSVGERDGETFYFIDNVKLAPEQGLADQAVPRGRAEIFYRDENGVTIQFADRLDPTEGFKTVEIVAYGRLHAPRTVTADRDEDDPKLGYVSRAVRTVMTSVFLGGGVLISDKIPDGDPGSGKSSAKNGHIVFDDAVGHHHVDGDIISNGGINYGNTELTDDNVQDFMPDFSGRIKANLSGTSGEIPDFTNPDSSDQLFDFDRFIAAAEAGAGQSFNSLQEFVDAMNTANDNGEPLEGIIVLNVDSNAEGNNPKIESNSKKKGDDLSIPDGINIEGTLLFNFSPGTPESYKVFIKTPLYINATPILPGETGEPDDIGSGRVDPSDKSTWISSFPPELDSVPAAHEVDISGEGFANFSASDDLPALMFNNGIVDIHHDANIGGVVFGPSFIEIENKDSLTQFFKGAIIGGAGLFLEAKDGTQIFAFDPDSLDNLAVVDDAKGFTITFQSSAPVPQDVKQSSIE